MLKSIISLFMGKKKEDHHIKTPDELNKWRDEVLQKMKRVEWIITSEKSGWKDICVMIDEYIATLLMQKLAFKTHEADSEGIEKLKAVDREIDMWMKVKSLPSFLANNCANTLENKPKDELEEVAKEAFKEWKH